MCFICFQDQRTRTNACTKCGKSATDEGFELQNKSFYDVAWSGHKIVTDAKKENSKPKLNMLHTSTIVKNAARKLSIPLKHNIHFIDKCSRIMFPVVYTFVIIAYFVIYHIINKKMREDFDNH